MDDSTLTLYSADAQYDGSNRERVSASSFGAARYLA